MRKVFTSLQTRTIELWRLERMTQLERLDDRILVLEDDHKLMRLLRASLEQAAYQVVVVYEGETALHALRCEHLTWWCWT